MPFRVVTPPHEKLPSKDTQVPQLKSWLKWPSKCTNRLFRLCLGDRRVIRSRRGETGNAKRLKRTSLKE